MDSLLKQLLIASSQIQNLELSSQLRAPEGAAVLREEVIGKKKFNTLRRIRF